MADSVAKLGIEVDANGALRVIEQVEKASTKMGASATKAAEQVRQTWRYMNAEEQARLDALNKRQRAENRAIQEQERAVRVAREFAAAQRALAAAEEARAAKAAAAADRDLQARGRMEAAAHQMNDALDKARAAANSGDAAFGKMRGAVTALGTSLAGMNGPLASTVSTLTNIAAGGGAAVAVVAGITAIVGAFTVLKDITERQTKAQKEATAALLDFYKARAQGAGAELGGNIAGALKEQLARQKDILRQIEQARDADVSVAGAKVGSSDGKAAADRRVKVLQDEYNRIGAAMAEGRKEMNRQALQERNEQSAIRTAQLADLIKANQATKAERKAAIESMANLRDSLSRATSGEDRLRLAEQIKELNEALNPKPTKEFLAAQKEAKAFREAYAASLIGTAAAIAEAIAEEAMAWDKARAAAEPVAQKRATAATFELAQMETKRQMIGAEGEALAQLEARYTFLQKLSEGYSVAGALAFTAVKTATDEATKAMEQQERVLNRLKKQADDEARRRERHDRQGQAWMANGVSAGLSFVNAPSASSLGGVAGAFTGNPLIGSFVGQLADSLDLFGEHAKRAAAAQRAYNQALDDYAIVQRTAVEEAQRANNRALNGLVQAAGAASGVSVTGDVTDAASLRSIIDALPSGVKEFDAFRIALERLYAEATRNAAIIDAQHAAEQVRLQEDYRVRQLVAEGRTADAEALRFAIEQQREYADAVKSGATALTLAALSAAQFAEYARREWERLEGERRSIFDLTNGARAFTDPRGASDAAFFEAQNRRVVDAIARQASAAEMAAIELFNLAEAADRARQIAEQDRRVTEGLTARGASALGNAGRASDIAFAAGQRQEMADAIREGMSPSNLALLQFVQFAEASERQMLKAIEAGTKAIQTQAANEIAAIDLMIEAVNKAADAELKRLDGLLETEEKRARAEAKAFDEQIAAIREQTKAQTDALDASIDAARSQLDVARDQLSALEASVATNQKVVEALQSFRDSVLLGDLSTLSPGDKLDEARRQFEALVAAAQGGNANAAQQLPGAGNALLQASRAFNASNSGFVADFNRVLSATGAVQGQFGATLPTDVATLEAARQQVASLERSIEIAQQQRDAIVAAADKQIQALEKQKDAAAIASDKIITELRDQRTKVEADRDAAIVRLEEDRQRVIQWEKDSIAALREIQEAAHQSRLIQHDLYEVFAPLVNGLFGRGNGSDGRGFGGFTPGAVPPTQDAPFVVAQQEGTAAIKAQTVELSTRLTRVEDGIAALLSTVAAGSDEETGATRDVRQSVREVRTAIGQLAEQLRSGRR